jgi:hypothetical protein
VPDVERPVEREADTHQGDDHAELGEVLEERPVLDG